MHLSIWLGAFCLLFLSASPVSKDRHAAWDTLLRRHVDGEGRVNYAGLVSEKAALKAYLRALAQHPPTPSWSRAEKMAYWINAYNAFTVDLVVEHYPVESITQIDGGKPWDVKRIRIGDVFYSLNDIEHEILRKQFGDARIHFALNCAARSCPPLYGRAYTAENLERTLEERTRKFIRDVRFNRIAPNRLEVSRIFEWYADDFGDVRAFLSRYSGIDIAPDAVLTFAEYDWRLNSR